MCPNACTWLHLGCVLKDALQKAPRKEGTKQLQAAFYGSTNDESLNGIVVYSGKWEEATFSLMRCLCCTSTSSNSTCSEDRGAATILMEAHVRGLGDLLNLDFISLAG